MSVRLPSARSPLPLPQADLHFRPGSVVRELAFVMKCLEGIVLLLDVWFFCGGVILSYDLHFGTALEVVVVMGR